MNNSHWRLSSETYEYIKGEVAHVIVSYDVSCIPVSGFEIASKLGIAVVPFSSLSVTERQAAERASKDALSIQKSGLEYIYYNDEMTYERTNWSILHEIGHFILDHTGQNPEYEEAEADFFAKYAIAPPILIDEIQPTSPLDIYVRFRVSMEAAQYAFEYYQKWRSHVLHEHYIAGYDRQIRNHYITKGGMPLSA